MIFNPLKLFNQAYKKPKPCKHTKETRQAIQCTLKQINFHQILKHIVLNISPHAYCIH